MESEKNDGEKGEEANGSRGEKDVDRETGRRRTEGERGADGRGGEKKKRAR